MNNKGKKVTAAAVLMFFLLTSVFPAKAAVGQVTRTSGVDRYSTAAEVARLNWKNSDNVVLVCGEGYADAVSGAVLAKKLNGPILLTTPTSLSPQAEETLKALKVKNIYVIGGEASVSQKIRSELKGNYNLIELGGIDRYETNVKVAEKLVDLGVNPANVIMVGGTGFSDALSVAPIAAAKGEILLLGMNDDESIKPALNFINSHKSKVTVVGTKNVIDDEILNSFNGRRIDGGLDRFDTNLSVLDNFKDSVQVDKLYVANATGEGYADALVASALAGKYASPLVLVDIEDSVATAKAIDYIKSTASSNTDLNVIGGPGVVSDKTIDAINKSLQSPVFSGKITSVETVDNQVVNIKINDQKLPFTVNGGKSVSLTDLVEAGYGIKFVTSGPVFGYDSNTSTSQSSVDGTVDKTALTYFYYGSTTDTSKVANDFFKYQVQIYKNNSLIAVSDFTKVNIIDGDTTAEEIRDYTIKLLNKNSEGDYVTINPGDRNAATKESNLATRITSRKLIIGEKASVSEVKGTLVNGGTNLNISNVKFYSSNTFIASVDEISGVISTNAVGDFILTIKSGSQSKDISLSVVQEERRVANAESTISSIKMGKGTSSKFYLKLIDQYGDVIDGNPIVPTISTSSIANGSTRKGTDYQLQYVSNSSGNPIAYEKVLAQGDKDGKTLIQVVNDGNTSNTGSGILKVVNNNGLTMLTLPVTVNNSVVVDSIKLEPVRDENSEDLTLDLNPQAAMENNNSYIRINFNKYGADGTSLGYLNSSSSDFSKYRFYISQDANKKIIDDSKTEDKSLIPMTMNPDGSIIITTPYGITDKGFTEAVTSTIAPSNIIEDNKNIITFPCTGPLTLIAKSYDPVNNIEGGIINIIKIDVKNSSPTISNARFENNIQLLIPPNSKGGDVVNMNIKDVLKESNISINGSGGDGKVRIAANGAVFINYKEDISGSIANIQKGEPSYDASADILLGYIVAAPKDSNISYTVVNSDGTISAKLAEGKTSGKFSVGIVRYGEKTPFATATVTIDQN